MHDAHQLSGKRIKPTIMEFLVEDPVGLTQKRLLTLYSNASEKVSLKRHLGSLGGQATALKNKQKAVAKASSDGMPTITITRPIKNSIKRGGKNTGLKKDYMPCKKAAVNYWKTRGRTDLSYELIADEFFNLLQGTWKRRTKIGTQLGRHGTATASSFRGKLMVLQRMV